jgi:hypothetical protein
MRPEVSGGFGIQYLFDFEAGAKQEQHRDIESLVYKSIHTQN